MEALSVALAELSVAIVMLFFSIGCEFVGWSAVMLIDWLMSLLKEPTESPALSPAAATFVSKDEAPPPSVSPPRAATI